MRLTGVIIISVAFVLSLPASASVEKAPVDKYHVTAEEKIACTRDAMRLCFGAYPDEDKLLTCMVQNHSELTPTCRVAFDAGVRRRHP